MSQIPNHQEPGVEPSDSSEHRRDGVTRRQILTGAAGAAVGLAGSMSVQAQYSGIMEGGLGVPFRLPLGALNYLDRNEYIHNMEIISYTEGRSISSGEPLMAMWAQGDQRLLPSGSGWLDLSNPRDPAWIDAGVRIHGALA